MVPAEIIMTDEKNSSDFERRGVEGLTEVLRLQAEALSRISERMAGKHEPQADSPTGMHSHHPHLEPPRDASHLPVLAGDPALGEDSLPVLNSFKKFLDQERRHTRKRMLWALAAFTVVFAVVLTAIVLTGNDRVRELKTGLSQAGTLVEQTRRDANDKMKRIEEQTALAATQNVSQMRKDITRNILWAHSVISSNMSAELTGRDGEMDRMKEKLSELEIANAMLARRVSELDQRLKTLEQPLGGIPMDEAGLSDLTPGSLTNAQPIPLMINSARFGRSFQLRMPQK